MPAGVPKRTVITDLKLKQTERRVKYRDEYSAKKKDINRKWEEHIAEKKYRHAVGKPIWESAPEDSALKWLEILDGYGEEEEMHHRKLWEEEIQEWHKDVKFWKGVLDEKDAKEMDALLHPKPVPQGPPCIFAPRSVQLNYYKTKYPHLFKEENTAQYQDREEWDHYNFQDSQGNVFSIE